MRHWTACVALTVVGVFGLLAGAADKPPADYQAAMKDLGTIAQGLDKAVMADDYATVTKYADAAKKDFEVAEMYWKAKARDAFELAEAGGKAAFDLGVAAGFMSKEGVAFAAKQLTEVCAQCHMAHRETMPDGTFQIK